MIIIIIIIIIFIIISKFKNVSCWNKGFLFYSILKVFVSRCCYKSGPLNLIGQFSRGGIGWKTRVKVVR